MVEARALKLEVGQQVRTAFAPLEPMELHWHPESREPASCSYPSDESCQCSWFSSSFSLEPCPRSGPEVRLATGDLQPRLHLAVPGRWGRAGGLLPLASSGLWRGS